MEKELQPFVLKKECMSDLKNEFMTFEEFTEDLEKPLPWHEDLYYRFYRAVVNPYKEFVFQVKVWLARAFKGYARYDVWNYAGNNSKRAVKLLTELKAIKLGCPLWHADPETGKDVVEEELWNSYLEDMIFYHKVVAGLPRPPEAQYSTLKFKITHSWYEQYNLLPEEKARYRRGKYYYYKYYDNLAD